MIINVCLVVLLICDQPIRVRVLVSQQEGSCQNYVETFVTPIMEALDRGWESKTSFNTTR